MDVTDRSTPSSEQRVCAHGWLLAAVFAAVLPSAAMAQGSDTETPPTVPAAGATDNGTTGLNLPVPPVVFNAYADLAEGYSTNAQAGGASGNGADSFTRGRVGLTLQYNKPRLTADLAYSLTGSYWAKFHQLNHLTNRLNLASHLVAVPDMLIITANVFAAPADLTRAGVSSASGEPISRFNTRDTYGYFVQPEFILRYKDYLTNTLSASQGAVFFVMPGTSAAVPPPPIVPAENSFSTTVSDQITSGSYFDRVQFSLSGSYSQYSQTVRTQRDTEGLFTLTYAVTRWLKIFGTGGYSDFKSTQKLAKNLAGPTGLGGFTLTSDPDFVLTVEAGTQNNFPTYMGSLHWTISPLTQFIVTANDGINTPQGEILGRLSQMGGYGDGNFSDNGTGLGIPPVGGYTPFSPGGLALDNTINRVRSVDATLVHTDELNTYSASLFANERDRLDVTPGSHLPRSSVYGVRGSASRKLGADTTATLSAVYSIGNEFGGHDRIFYGDARLSHNLTDTFQVYLTNHYTHRDSKSLVGFPNVPVAEDQIILGIRANF